VTKTKRERRPPEVPTMAKQGGEVRARWAWTEPSVWTERMLAALENGVKGGVWFSLMDKVYAPRNLEAAAKRVERHRGAAGIDGQRTEQFAARRTEILERLHEELREGTYQPDAVRRVWIPKPGSTQKRPLGIPTVRDRVVQGALRAVLEPIFERRFAAQSYGFRPGRGCKDALRRVDELLEAGCTFVVDADLQGYFDSIDHELLIREVGKEVADRKVLALVEKFLKQGVMDGLETWEPERGSPQGAVISPLLSNVFLHPLDLVMRDAGFEMVRYADDLVILCTSRAAAEQALALLAKEVTARKLTLHPDKTCIVDMTQPGGFDFLGYHFERGRKIPRKKSLQKLRDRVREITPRQNGNSLDRIIATLNRVLRGWFEYFKHCARPTFDIVDGFARRRLRAILLCRRHRRHFGAGIANIRWPNAYFAEHGLFSLAAAHAHARHP
jgi:RNA-directed DNA polymerase